MKSIYNFIKRILIEFGQMIKTDTLEIFNKYLMWQSRRPTKTTHLNFWAYFLIIVVSFVIFIVYLPLILGMMSIIFNIDSNVPTTAPSVEAITSFIILATALGTLILWFAERKYPSGEIKRNTSDIKMLGKGFLFSSLSLSLFLLLCPLMPEVKDKLDLYSNFIKYLSLFSFLGGSASFVISIIMGLFYVWKL